MESTDSPASHAPPDTKKILIATDLSSAADTALVYALQLASRAGAELVLLHVMDGPPAPGWSHPAEGFLTERERAHGEISGMLESRIKEHLHEGRISSLPPVQVLVVDGDPAAEIVMMAFDCCADLIVIGPHGEKDPASTVFGSTAEKVVHYASCPVLVARDRKSELNLPPIHPRHGSPAGQTR